MKCTSLLLTGLKLACQFLLNLANTVFSTVTFVVSMCCQYFSVSALLELLFVSLKMTREKEEENICKNSIFKSCIYERTTHISAFLKKELSLESSFDINSLLW